MPAAILHTYHFLFLCIQGLLYFPKVIKAFDAPATSDNDNIRSQKARAQTAAASRSSYPSNPLVPRANYPPSPDYQPQVCLAFLSCCGRTDLLNHTLAGAIRHMEEDEPEGFQYEIAWVDNGSGAEKQQYILDHFQIDHALPMKENKGLAYGMNLLNLNLCTAPYILLLEEDWLYTDSTIAHQTPQRKRVISTAIALTETNLYSFDMRRVMGAFLRSDRYHEFLEKPSIGEWKQKEINMDSVLNQGVQFKNCPPSSENDICTKKKESKTNMVTVDYQVFCGERDLGAIKEAFGSYTNGSGLYKREYLRKIGRMYGEPGDSFNFRYAEANYAFRAMQDYCHVAIRLDYDEENMKLCEHVGGKDCTAAFNHIGAGRGTFPMDKASAKCVGFEWLFHGVPKFDEARKRIISMENPDRCGLEEVKEFTNAQNHDSERHQQKVKENNENTFALETKQRETMRDHADIIKRNDLNAVRASNSFFRDMTDEEIYKYADGLVARANSPHPINGFWDSHGFPIVGNKRMS